MVISNSLKIKGCPGPPNEAYRQTGKDHTNSERYNFTPEIKNKTPTPNKVKFATSSLASNWTITYSQKRKKQYAMRK